ncbi:unnamed protein product [Protopolystoma xenopodis]|uniref:DH domain-containing protein n=1 Tax=Protopolystoma xenopodis TaxID=117903 RepID=A0A3S5ALN7_9PLAT|nr:unnamed protein product [Protopolystoma xenopodis]
MQHYKVKNAICVFLVLFYRGRGTLHPALTISHPQSQIGVDLPLGYSEDNPRIPSAVICIVTERESFRQAVARLHSDPICGKNRLDSFLALPMQRLTRLKLLVEVIQKLQIAVAEDAAKVAELRATTGSITNTIPRVPTPQERENVEKALEALKRVPVLSCNRGNVTEWLKCQAHMLHCHGSTPAGGVEKTYARSKLQSTLVENIFWDSKAM